MIKPEAIAVGQLVRLRCGSPKFIVYGIGSGHQSEMIDLFGWSDRLGFFSYTVPLAFLVYPRQRDDDGKPDQEG